MGQRLAVCLFLVFAGGSAVGFRAAAAPRAAALQTTQEDEDTARLLRLQSWATAVRDHEPGKFDTSASSINDWAPVELREVVSEAKEIAQFLETASERLQKLARSSAVIPFDLAVTIWEDQALLGLTDDEVAQGNANRILKRGALLHADIALLAPPDNRHVVTPSPLTFGDMVYLYADGVLQGIEYSGVHWTIARALLDEVKPNPSQDETVRLWYRATGACLQTQHTFVYAEPLLADGRRIFPADADILLYSGSLHENYATPQVQASTGPSERAIVVAGVRSAREELRQAQRFFRQAVEHNPRLTEARIRLGRVLELSGQAQEAAAELRRASAEADNGLLHYYAELFLGQAEQALGHRDAAREAFEHAARLYPRAQSPSLALSQLARRYDDRGGALGALQLVLTLPGDERSREDPWWYYHGTHVPDASTLLRELRKSFSEERPQ
jgi:tetratricopeptide (TPR) repeat protein